MEENKTQTGIKYRLIVRLVFAVVVTSSFGQNFFVQFELSDQTLDLFHACRAAND